MSIKIKVFGILLVSKDEFSMWILNTLLLATGILTRRASSFSKCRKNVVKLRSITINTQASSKGLKRLKIFRARINEVARICRCQRFKIAILWNSSRVKRLTRGRCGYQKWPGTSCLGIANFQKTAAVPNAFWLLFELSNILSTDTV